MTAETQRTLIAVARKVVLACLVLLIAWLGLWGLRGTIPARAIQQLNAEKMMDWESPTGEISLNSRDWDWSRSLWSGKPVSDVVGARLGTTVGIMALGGVLSLLTACLVLFIGILISRVTRRPPWLAKTSGILRLVLVSAAVSAPFFAWETLVIVYPSLWWGWTPSALLTAALFVSVLPAWLLVQYGHGEISTWPEKPAPFEAQTWRRLVPSLSIRLLKLVGAVAVLTVLAEQNAAILGLGRTLTDTVNRRDFTLLFAMVWAFVIIVVLVKLAADLIELAYARYAHAHDQTAAAHLPAAGNFGIPRWWLIVCLVLVAFFAVAAVATPVIAPYDYNEMSIGARIMPPSAAHVLGTDNLGRDLFSRLLFALREDILLSLFAVAIVFVVAVGWAMLAAHVRRRNDWRGDTVEDMVLLPGDILCAFPWLALLLLLRTIWGVPSGSPLTFAESVLPLVLIIGLLLLPRAAGMIREGYRSPATGDGLFRSVLSSLPAAFLFALAGGILYMATVGYIGFGVPPPQPELGSLLSGPARRYMLQAPWMAVWPATTLMLLMLVLVMAGDALLERMGFKSKAIWSKVWE